MGKTFEDALGDLLADHADDDPEELISALELALMALKEEHSGRSDERQP